MDGPIQLQLPVDMKIVKKKLLQMHQLLLSDLAVAVHHLR